MLLFMVAFFSTPLLLVMLMYKLDWHPSGKSHGELLSSAKSLALPAGLMDNDSNAVPDTLFKDRWSMVYVAYQCEAVCLNKLHDMRQIHASLAKHIPRVQRVLLTADQDVAELRSQYQDLVILNRPSVQREDLMRQFDLENEDAGLVQRIYLVDPLGNLMMSYTPQMAASDVREDLYRLLSYAWAG